MSEITIVTAFFDIGRKDMEGFNRDNQTYFDYFKFWARINNKMIIYTDSNLAEKVLKIRSDFNLENKTTVIPIDNFEELVPESLAAMKKGLSHPLTRKFRKNIKSPETYNHKYTYVMFLKPWLINNAINTNLAKGMIAWVDFGYNHGGKTYINPEEFDFTWQYDFSHKIHLFHLKEINTLPIFEVIRQMPVDMSGGVIVAPDEYWSFLSNSFINSVECLSKCGFADDDQTLLLMAYRNNPEIFELHLIPDWFLVFKNFGGEHLTIGSKSNYKIDKQNSINEWKDKQYKTSFFSFLKYSYKKLKRLIVKSN